MLPRSLVLAFLAVSLVAPAALAAPVNLESRVDSVTVFPNGVSIRRLGRTRVAAGSQQVQFGPLPANLADETIRIGGFGPGVTAESVTVRSTTMGELEGPALARLEATVTATSRQRDALAERRPAMVRAAAEAPAGPERVRAATRLADLDRRLGEIERRLAEQSRTLVAARADAARAVKVVAVDLTANDAGDLALSIEYMVPGAAAWRPSYAARLDAEGGRVALDLFATVQQQTGEDWRDVSLSVSSVVPAGGLALPTFDEWSIELVAPDPAELAALAAPARADDALGIRAMPGVPGVAPRAVPVPAVRPPRPPAPIEQAQGVARPNLLAARLDIPGRVSLVSGAPARRVLAAHADLESTLEYQAAPRQSSSVFLAARFRNTNPFPLLAGPAALFVGTDYVGTTSVSQTGIEEEVLLPFGIDSGVTIDRTLASRDVQQRGGRIDTTLRWQLRLTNHRQRPIEITVLDQLPVSRTAGLTVAIVPGSRAAEPHHETDLPGVLRWRVRADAAETERWSFGYTVSAPRNRELAGTID